MGCYSPFRGGDISAMEELNTGMASNQVSLQDSVRSSLIA